HPLYGRLYQTLSNIHRRKGHFQIAKDLIEQAIKIKEKVYKDPKHPSIAEAKHVLVKIFYHMYQFTDYEKTLQEILDSRNHAYGEDHPLVGSTYQEFGAYYMLRANYKKAIDYFNKA